MSYNKLSSYATTVFNEDGWYKVVYHSTCIVKWNEDQIILDNGGWQTATTKKKMNQAANQFNLGFQVYQEDFDWFVYLDMVTPFEFENGMIINRKSGADEYITYPDTI
jgi:hypothetical protein